MKDGSLDFNLISLFPPTYKGRKNGLRLDIAEALEGLHPVSQVLSENKLARHSGKRVRAETSTNISNPQNKTFFRFPGGNMLEGDDIDNWWDWKDSLGPLRYRKGFQNTWGYEMTNGLGLMEYLLWAEDMGMEMSKWLIPFPAIFPVP